MKLALMLVAASLIAPISFSQCPAVGADTTGCEVLITANTATAGGVVTAFTVAKSAFGRASNLAGIASG